MTATSTLAPVRTWYSLASEVTAQRDQLRGAMVGLDRVLQAPTDDPVSAWQASVRLALDALQVAVARHTTVTEAPDGLLAQIVAAAPHLEHAVQSVRAEHSQIDRQLAMLTAVVEAAQVDPVEVSEAAIALLAVLAHHRERGIRLTYDAFSSDLGVGD